MSPVTTMANRRAVTVGVARKALLAYAAAGAVPPRVSPPAADAVPADVSAPDAGPPVLAALVAESDCSGGSEAADRAIAAWLAGLRAGVGRGGLSAAGVARIFAGAHAARSLDPRLPRLGERLRASLTAWSAAGDWRTEMVGWHDYDLITGPAGVVLALATDPACPTQSVLPAARHLASLADASDLRRLRVGAHKDDELRGWNFRRINTGLGHGIPGVAAALCAACDIAGSSTGLLLPLGRVARWLETESFVDARGVRTWAFGSLDGRRPPAGASHRQAWCYGTPGVSWPLWEAGRLLGDAAVQGFAVDAMRSLCAVWDDAFYIDRGELTDALAVCHGVAGTLAVADAFARHAGVAEAASLRDHLTGYLLDRLEQVAAFAAVDLSLLSGAGGVLAVLLTVMGGRRDWLAQLALR